MEDRHLITQKKKLYQKKEILWKGVRSCEAGAGGVWRRGWVGGGGSGRA